MKPAPFEYVRASSVEEAVSALSSPNEEAKILAGGQSLVPLLALRLAHPEVLVDINGVPGLDQITSLGARDPGGNAGALASGHDVRVGALVRHSSLATQSRHPLLAEAARWIGHTAIRSRGTLGGSLAHADPTAEIPVVAAALEATVHVVGADGARSLGALELFTGTLETCLASHEMIVAVDMPQPEQWGFSEIARHQGDFALVTVVVAVVAGRWRVAIGGVGHVVQRATQAEEILDAESGARSSGGPLSPQTVTSAAAAAAATLRPPSDIHASARYRRAMSEELTRRALTAAGNHRGGRGR